MRRASQRMLRDCMRGVVADGGMLGDSMMLRRNTSAFSQRSRRRIGHRRPISPAARARLDLFSLLTEASLVALAFNEVSIIRRHRRVR